MLLKPKPKCRSLQKGGNFFNVEVINMNELVNCLTFVHFDLRGIFGFSVPQSDFLSCFQQEKT